MASKIKLNKLIQLSNNEEAAIANLNKNVDIANEVITDYVSRSGKVPTQMLVPLDMGSQRIINVGTPVDDKDVVRYKDVKDAIEELKKAKTYKEDAEAAAGAAAVSASSAASSASHAATSEFNTRTMYAALINNPVLDTIYSDLTATPESNSVLKSIYNHMSDFENLFNTYEYILFNNNHGDFIGSISILGVEASADNTVAVGGNSNASATNAVAIGGNALASGNGAVAIGGAGGSHRYARATGDHSIAIGTAVGNDKGPLASANRAIQIGPGENADASTLSIGLDDNHNYKLLKSDGAVPFDRLKEIMIEGVGTPTPATVGFVSQLYRNTNNGKVYSCVAVSGGTYSWQELGSGGGGGGGTAEAYDCPAITSVGGVCTWTISHNMDSRDIQVSVYDTTNYTDAQCNITRPTANSVVVTFLSSSDITAGAYRVVLLASSAYGLAPNAIETDYDVALTSVANGDLLKYDSSAQKWKNTKSLGDVALGSATATTQATSDSSTKVATTEYVNNVLGASTTQQAIIAGIAPDMSTATAISSGYATTEPGWILFTSSSNYSDQWLAVDGVEICRNAGAPGSWVDSTAAQIFVGIGQTITFAGSSCRFVKCTAFAS